MDHAAMLRAQRPTACADLPRTCRRGLHAPDSVAASGSWADRTHARLDLHPGCERPALRIRSPGWGRAIGRKRRPGRGSVRPRGRAPQGTGQQAWSAAPYLSELQMPAMSEREAYDLRQVTEPARVSMSSKVAALMRGPWWQSRMVGPPHLRQRGLARSVTGQEGQPTGIGHTAVRTTVAGPPPPAQPCLAPRRRYRRWRVRSAGSRSRAQSCPR
jgi:hypothetical protein